MSEATPEETTLPERAVADQRHGVLVVDDEPDVRQYLVAILKDAGFTVLSAADGVAADTDAGALPETVLRRLVDRLVGQCSGPGDDADLAREVDMTGHDAQHRLAG